MYVDGVTATRNPWVMFIINFKHSELIVLRAAHYDDVEAERGTRFRTHPGQGASVYNMSSSHPLVNASRYQSLWSRAEWKRSKDLRLHTRSTQRTYRATTSTICSWIPSTCLSLPRAAGLRLRSTYQLA
jgi:hypothetical protein